MTEDVLTVGQFSYTRRSYTPKRRGATAGHGWVRDYNGHRAEVGQEVCTLLNEIERLRAMAAGIGDSPT